ncbi:MAG TPA: rod shape-determining protein RodA [Gaiellaceae bacterium]|jgi:rod shape determining protein RodA|nr:rod shape-determining protein RodA [Gaiellaceae bacterium]
MVEYVGTRHSRARTRRAARAEEPLVRRLDWTLLAAVAGVVAYGLWAIAGITRHDVPGNPNYFLVRQGIYAAIGGLGLVGAVLLDPSVYRRYWRGLFGGTVGLMLLVILAGAATRGSKRWIDVGFFRFQPSEFGKLLFVLALAGFLADRARKIGEPRTTLMALGLALVPIFLVFLQPDLGTALVYGAALAAILFVAGTPWTQLAGLGVGAVLFATAVLWVLPAAGIPVLKPYQIHRLTQFMNPTSDPRGATYNITQSITTVGAGGVHGRGVAGSTQTNLDYLPEHATDFAFASLAEQRGFLGASLLLCLYLILVWRGLRIVTLARDHFSALVAGGVVVGFLFQIFVNVGMTMGIAPITGIPLPFVSVGGSSMIANLVAMGVLLSIYARGRERR